MAIFKYTIANKEGKKLSGSVEAPDENTARTELANLGFSILLLQETKEAPKIDSTLSKFAFEAIDKNNKLVSGTIPAKNQEDAAKKLQSEYDLNVSSIWPENATPEQITAARKEGESKFHNQLRSQSPTTGTPAADSTSPETTAQNLEQEKKAQFVKTKIELILKSVNELLQKFEQEISPDQKVEINKKIDKLLRIKNSTNFDYILETANELLKFLEEQEKSLKENTHQEKRFEYKVQTQKLLTDLNKKDSAKTLSESMMEKINKWQQTHLGANEGTSTGAKIINSILNPIKDFFTTPPEVQSIKEQIKIYNKQLWEFVKLYFKEPTAEYKEKVKNSLKTVWESRKKAKENLKTVIKQLKEEKNRHKIEEHLVFSFVEEMNALTGWLLTFYVIYYFLSLYLTHKNFGLSKIPNSFQVYESHIFKYILVITFLLHATSALKVNFFKNSMVANIILPPIFVFGSIIALLNF